MSSLRKKHIFVKKNSSWTKALVQAVELRLSQPAKIDLSKKWLPKQKTIQNFNFDAQGLRKTRNGNPHTPEKGVTS